MLLKQVDEAATGLFFLPGDPSDLNGFRWLEENKPDLALLELAVNGFQALQKGDVLLKHRPGQPAVAVVASAIEKGFADFLTEVLKLPDAHAMIHEKSIEADARHKNRWKVWCVYRSHNGGDKASISNDEHQYFVFGHRGLNIAFMVHHIDVCDHNRFRMMVNQNSKDDSLMGYLSQDDTWQDKYFVEGGAPMRELDYLTRDDDYDDDAPVPDFLKEDPDPKAFDKWGDVGADWEAEAHAADLAELSDAGITNDEPTKAGPSTPVDPDAADKKPEKPPSRHPPHGGSRAHCDAAKATPKQSATSRLRALAKRCFGG
jgi:hypothetical protein